LVFNKAGARRKEVIVLESRAWSTGAEQAFQMGEDKLAQLIWKGIQSFSTS
jgi:hypothetical protein